MLAGLRRSILSSLNAASLIGSFVERSNGPIALIAPTLGSFKGAVLTSFSGG